MALEERLLLEERLKLIPDLGNGHNGEAGGGAKPMPIEEFGKLTFNRAAMAKNLSKAVYEKLLNTVVNNTSLDLDIAEEVAHGMKEWAILHGATHFCLWFQPMRGVRAEKHDSFLSIDAQGQPIQRFSGKQLIQGEPDASSFPSGGMRSTFEARGYTAWDPTSPAYLLKTGKSATLVIPSVFLSWTGEALDMKTPLLRSLHAVEERAYKLLKLFGNRSAKFVRMTLGPEQEYFLVSKEFYNERPDLICAGRTLLGAASAKDQQMEDHYFGSIKPKILEFMAAVDTALFARGIPAKTRHNEVAPNQFEIAPLYEEANLAVDHNLQAMDIMRKVADDHGFAILFHEKPFNGMNGNGKHLNWSLTDSDGNNLLEPGQAPKKNVQFLTYVAALLAGVDKFGGLIRCSVSDAGNDHRLGANEAPPAVMSVYLGDYLARLLDEIEEKPKATEKGLAALEMGIKRLPKITRDNSDRNRTSPIAFTGNKFEFRAVGGSQSTSEPAAVFALIMAYGIDQVLRRIETQRGQDISAKALAAVKEIVKETKRIRFEGNNYGGDWHKEAAKRGLPCAKDTPEALPTLTGDAVVELYSLYSVLNHAELQAKREIRTEAYIKTKVSELKLIKEMAETGVIPALLRQIDELGKADGALKALGAGKARGLKARLGRAAAALEEIEASIEESEKIIEKLLGIDGHDKQARFLADKGVKSLDRMRLACAEAESLIDFRQWPFPKYREMLFLL